MIKPRNRQTYYVITLRPILEDNNTFRKSDAVGIVTIQHGQRKYKDTQP
jgi:hypothetical protein